MNTILLILAVGSLWTSDSAGEFRRGDFKHVSLSAVPEVRLAPELAELGDTRQMLLLCLAADSRGTVYAGTGTEGGVFRITKRNAQSLFSLIPGQVLSLAVDRNDNVYAGTAPDGVIYRISGDKSEEYFDTHQKYVWSLAFDEAGNLYAGTGDSGLVYRITGRAAGSVFHDASEPHITALTWAGSLYAGSSGSGLVYRIREGDARVLFKTDRSEVKCLVVDRDGTVFAAANPDDKAFDARPLLYRIRPDGNGSVIFSPPDSMIYAMVRSGKRLLVGTGSKARVYEVNADTAAPDFGIESLVLESNEGQILSLLPVGGTSRVVVGTGNSGKAYRLESGYAQEGTFESRIFDTRAISHWGRCFWSAKTPVGTGVTLATRTGNSEHPDETWESWQTLRGDQVISRPARYIQFRAILATADDAQTPTLSQVTIAYEQTNLPPEFKAVQVKTSEDANRRQDLVVVWDANDPNGDSLAASVYVRGEKDQGWLTLEENKSGITRYTIDTQRLPDGWYKARVVVSDRPGRPLGTDFSAERSSSRFLVDNTPPRIAELSATPVAGDRYRLSFVVSDELSLVSRCDISTNVRDWRPAAPKSGIFDAQVEEFELEVNLSRGENVIVVRAADDLGNVGTAKKVIELP